MSADDLTRAQADVDAADAAIKRAEMVVQDAWDEWCDAVAARDAVQARMQEEQR